MSKAKKPGKAKGKPRKRPLSTKQKKLVKNLKAGMAGADAAIAAGYACKSRHSAAVVAHQTVARLTGRPVFRDALQRRGITLEVVADYVQAALEGKQVTEICDVVPDPKDPNRLIRQVKQVITKDDGRSRAQALRWIMEAFEAEMPGETENPWDGATDDDLEAMVAAGLAPAGGAGPAGAAAPQAG